MLAVFKSVLFDVNFLGAFFQSVIIVTLGYFFRRKGLVDHGGKKVITAIVWKISVPCVAFNAFMQDFSRTDFATGLWLLGISVVIYALLLASGKFLFRHKGDEESMIAGLFAAVGQTTLFSMPILLSVYAGQDEQVSLYISSVSIAFRIMVYIVGFYLISGEKFLLRHIATSLKKVFVTPIMVGMFLGLAIWLLQDALPKVSTASGLYAFARVDKTLPALYMTVTSLCKLLTPLSMFLIGMSVGETNILASIEDKDAWLIALLRNFAAPVFVLLFACALHALGVVHFDEHSLVTLVIAFSAPVSVTLSMTCVEYHRHEVLATRACIISTVLTALSMPFCFVLVRAALSSPLFAR